MCSSVSLYVVLVFLQSDVVCFPHRCISMYNLIHMYLTYLVPEIKISLVSSTPDSLI